MDTWSHHSPEEFATHYRAAELAEALVVNPYNIDECAAALHLALTMPGTEQRARMRSLRGLLQSSTSIAGRAGC